MEIGANSVQADNIKVDGTVTLSNATVFARSKSDENPAVVQRFGIVSEEGTDPIAGTFANLPEGATFSTEFGLTFSSHHQN